MDHVCSNKGEPWEAAGWAENWDQELIVMEENRGEEEPTKDVRLVENCDKKEKEKQSDEEEPKEGYWVGSCDEMEKVDKGMKVGESRSVKKIALGGGNRSLQEDEAKEAVRNAGKTGDSVNKDRDEALGEKRKENETGQIAPRETKKETETGNVVKWERGDDWEETTNIEEKSVDSKSNVKASGPFSWYNPVTVAELFIVGWRCLFLVLKTLETTLAVSPRSSPYSLDLFCSLRHLSVPASRQEIQQRFMDNYAAFSGEYYRLLRSVVCCCVCRFASPWRVVLAVAFLAFCGFIPLEDRRVGPYLIPRDFQRVFLCFVALCVSGVLDIVAWCLLLACPFVVLHLLFHDSSSSSHRPIFSNLVWS